MLVLFGHLCRVLGQSGLGLRRMLVGGREVTPRQKWTRKLRVEPLEAKAMLAGRWPRVE